MDTREKAADESVKSCAFCLCDGRYDSQEDKNIGNCSLCGKKYDQPTLGGVESFPVPRAKQSATHPEAISVEVCQICQQLAASFCRECDGLFCPQHQKRHDQFHYGAFKKKHEIIPVDEYCKAKARRSLRMCSQHPDIQVDEMCIKCGQLNCSTCRTSSHDFNCPSGEKHMSRRVQGLAADMRVKVTGARAEMDETIGDLKELMELCAKKREENETEFNNFMSTVEHVMEEQLEAIRSQYVELKTNINAWRLENIQRKDAYQRDLQDKIKRMENLFNDVNVSMQQQMHPVDLIQHGVAYCEEVDKCRGWKLIPLEFLKMELRPCVHARAIELQFGSVDQFLYIQEKEEAKLMEIRSQEVRRQELEISVLREKDKNKICAAKMAESEAMVKELNKKNKIFAAKMAESEAMVKELNEKNKICAAKMAEFETMVRKLNEKNKICAAQMAESEALVKEVNDKYREIERKLSDMQRLPVKLLDERVLKLSDNALCFSVCHTSDGGLVAGGQRVFDIRDLKAELIRSVPLAGSIYGCAVHDKRIYLLYKDSNNQRHVKLYNTQGQRLKSWPVTVRDGFSNLAVVAENIIVPARSEKRLYVYSMQGQLLRTISHPSFSGSDLFVAATSADSFITTDYSSQLVTKFNLQNGQAVWQAKGPAVPMAPAVDAAGRIWVPSHNRQTIHVLSSEGAAIKVFDLPGATDVLGVSVHRDQLVLADPKTGLIWYKMAY